LWSAGILSWEAALGGNAGAVKKSWLPHLRESVTRHSGHDSVLTARQEVVAAHPDWGASRRLTSCGFGAGIRGTPGTSWPSLLRRVSGTSRWTNSL
jgi:hypothetical protein